MTKQQNVFAYIVAYKKAHDGNSPTMRQIAQHFDFVNANTAMHHLDRLEDAGLIKREKGKASSIEVVGGKWIAP